jgi:hypothetical protein
MSKEMTEQTEQSENNLVKAFENKGIELKTFSPEKIEQISKDLIEHNRAMSVFGRRNTQTTNKLMTMTMLNGDGSPYRLLRQAMTEIEDRKNTLRVNLYKLQKSKVKLKKLKRKLENEADYLEKELLQIRIEELESGLQSSTLYIEGAMKDIASFQDAYKQIKEANNIPDNWDEKDMENAEVDFHVRRAFELLYRDIMVHGRIGMGTIEYMAQFGIHPQTATTYVQMYIQDTEKMIKEDKRLPNIDSLDDFLDEMVKLFRNEYKLTLKKMGIDPDNYVTEFAQFTEIAREEQRLIE